VADEDFDLNVLAWEDWYGEVHGGKPTDIADVQGMFSTYEDATGVHHHWVYIDPPPFEDWDSWYLLISDIAADHG